VSCQATMGEVSNNEEIEELGDWCWLSKKSNDHVKFLTGSDYKHTFTAAGLK